MIASLGGFLGRKGDGEPGVKTIWLGRRRLHDISETWKLSAQISSPIEPPWAILHTFLFLSNFMLRKMWLMDRVPNCLVLYWWRQCPISQGLSYHHYNKITIDRVTAVNTPRGSGLSCQLKADVQYLRQCGLGVSPSRATISQSHSRYRVLWGSATDGIQESMITDNW